MDLNPGPIDPSVLFDQINHVTDDVWNNVERNALVTHERGSKLVEWNLNEEQIEILEECCFHVFTYPSVILKSDACLVSALVERWRSETNSFHFNCGEMTITLEDVGLILGLPVIGRPITCGLVMHPKSLFLKHFGQYGGNAKNAYASRGGISLTWLRDTFAELPENYTYDQLMLYTKAYVLYVCGAVLFPTSNKNTVHPKYLMLLDRVEDIQLYAWGAGVLAYLYRALHKATRRNTTSIYGCLTLLQVWAYERIRPGRPLPRPRSGRLIPRARAWAYSMDDSYDDRRENPHHHLVFYRGEIEGMEAGEVNWRPYDRFDERLGWDFFEARLAGSGRVPLIHFDIVEYQMPDRVMRQFDQKQSIPEPAEDMVALRAQKKNKYDILDYELLRAAYIAEWNHNQETLQACVLEALEQIDIEHYL